MTPMDTTPPAVHAGQNDSEKDSWVGKEIPAATLPSTTGKPVSFPADLKGKWTLLYFYPKDDTPGCTKQACSYRDNAEKFTRLGVQLFGISLDDLKSHEGFRSKFHLNFPLLSDSDHALSGKLGVYGKQKFGIIPYTGLSRDTFLVDPEGKIRQVWRKVSPATTMNETYEAVEKLVRK